MDPDPRYYLIGVILSLIVLAFTSAVDTALSAISRHRLAALQSENPTRAALVTRLLDEPYRFKSTVLCLNAGAIIAATACTLRISDGVALLWRIAILVGLLVLILIVSEALPKAIASRNPAATAKRLAGTMAFATALLRPFIGAVSFVVRPLVRAIAGPTEARAPLVTEEELLLMVNVGEEEGLIDSGEREMIEGIFSFGDTLVREVMLPRMDIIALDADVSLDTALDCMIEHGHSRVPVFEETIDQIVGILYIKDLLPILRAGRRDLTIGGLVRDAYFVPETMKVDQLLKELRTRKSHLAIMVDEYGGTAGLATIEDLLEEIVGDIQDEFDAEDTPFELVSEGEAIADARVSLDDLNDATGLHLTSSESDRLGGLVYEQLGRVPQVGDTVTLAPGVSITVLSVEGLGPKRLRITFPQPQELATNGDREGLHDDT